MLISSTFARVNKMRNFFLSNGACQTAHRFGTQTDLANFSQKIWHNDIDEIVWQIFRQNLCLPECRQKCLVKSTKVRKIHIGVNFTNILQADFSYKSVFSQLFFTYRLGFVFLSKEYQRKSCS